MKTDRRKNKHGRTGARRLPPQPSVEPVNPESMNYRAGWQDGRIAAERDNRSFFETLLTKRNVKDIKGLIEKRLGR